MSVFHNLPDNVWVLAAAQDNGNYMIHVRVHPNGKCKTYPNEVDFQEALDRVFEIQTLLGLPDDALMVSFNKAMTEQPRVLNRKAKNLFKSMGVPLKNKKSPSKEDDKLTYHSHDEE